MKRILRLLFFISLVTGLCQLFTIAVRAQDIYSIPPVVVKTVPEAGSTNVPQGELEIRVTFSKPMLDQSWSWSAVWAISTPESIGVPHYEADQKTCVLKVWLRPNQTYAYWLNSPYSNGFQDQRRQPAVPYLLVFTTIGD